MHLDTQRRRAAAPARTHTHRRRRLRHQRRRGRKLGRRVGRRYGRLGAACALGSGVGRAGARGAEVSLDLERGDDGVAPREQHRRGARQLVGMEEELRPPEVAAEARLHRRLLREDAVQRECKPLGRPPPRAAQRGPPVQEVVQHLAPVEEEADRVDEEGGPRERRPRAQRRREIRRAHRVRHKRRRGEAGARHHLLEGRDELRRAQRRRRRERRQPDRARREERQQQRRRRVCRGHLQQEARVRRQPAHAVHEDNRPLAPRITATAAEIAAAVLVAARAAAAPPSFRRQVPVEQPARRLAELEAAPLEHALGEPKQQRGRDVEAKRLPDRLELAERVPHALEPRRGAGLVWSATRLLEAEQDRLGLRVLLARKERRVAVEERPRHELQHVPTLRLLLRDLVVAGLAVPVDKPAAHYVVHGLVFDYHSPEALRCRGVTHRLARAVRLDRARTQEGARLQYVQQLHDRQQAHVQHEREARARGERVPAAVEQRRPRRRPPQGRPLVGEPLLAHRRQRRRQSSHATRRLDEKFELRLGERAHHSTRLHKTGKPIYTRPNHSPTTETTLGTETALFAKPRRNHQTSSARARHQPASRQALRPGLSCARQEMAAGRALRARAIRHRPTSTALRLLDGGRVARRRLLRASVRGAHGLDQAGRLDGAGLELARHAHVRVELHDGIGRRVGGVADGVDGLHRRARVRDVGRVEALLDRRDVEAVLLGARQRVLEGRQARRARGLGARQKGRDLGLALCGALSADFRDRAVHVGGARVEAALQTVLGAVAAAATVLVRAVVRVLDARRGARRVELHANDRLDGRHRLGKLHAEVRALGSPDAAVPGDRHSVVGGGGGSGGGGGCEDEEH